MTAGNNGTSKPEDDDPFGYLYEDGQAAAAAQRGQGGYGYPGPAAQPGVPRTSYNQVRAVGDRRQAAPPQQPQYGQQAPYGQQQPQYGGQQQAYGQAPYGQQPHPSQAHLGGPPTQVPGQRGRGSGGGPNTKGLLIAAVAVVAVVVIGITAALLSNTDDNTKDDTATPTAGPSAETSPSAEPSGDASEGTDAAASGELPRSDAATVKLTSPATTSTDIPGAKGENGAYVLLNSPGAGATWTFDVPKSGKYTLNVTFGVPGKDADATLAINGEAQTRPLNLGNFAKASEGAWDKGWTHTWANVQLNEGSNSIGISCQDGNKCEFALDQFSLEEGWRTS
ncbi:MULTISPECIES: carbohydrate-binding protein [unclassified Streptomyces]|uniref:carbohydrate-binding protein n=1 Tax=unclassified Streptomyces TaxID=2593676 RepID=UPI00382BF91C